MMLSYLIGSFQVCHHHLNLIGPEKKHLLLIKSTCKTEIQHTNKNKEWINGYMNPRKNKYTLHTSRDRSQRTHLANAGAVSIKLLSKFHLNPLIVNSITQTACMCACIHVFKCVCMCVCLCAHVSP